MQFQFFQIKLSEGISNRPALLRFCPLLVSVLMPFMLACFTCFKKAFQIVYFRTTLHRIWIFQCLWEQFWPTWSWRMSCKFWVVTNQKTDLLRSAYLRQTRTKVLEKKVLNETAILCPTIAKVIREKKFELRRARLKYRLNFKKIHELSHHYTRDACPTPQK